MLLLLLLLLRGRGRCAGDMEFEKKAFASSNYVIRKILGEEMGREVLRELRIIARKEGRKRSHEVVTEWMNLMKKLNLYLDEQLEKAANDYVSSL